MAKRKRGLTMCRECKHFRIPAIDGYIYCNKAQDWTDRQISSECFEAGVFEIGRSFPKKLGSPNPKRIGQGKGRKQQVMRKLCS